MKKKLIITLLSLILCITLSTSVCAIYAGCLYFTDFEYDEWWCKCADEAYLDGYMFGVGGGCFAPKREVTFAELITVLYRLSATPKVIDSTTGNHKWYHLEVLWAESIGIFDRDVTDPESIATRDEIVNMIYSLVLRKNMDVSAAQDTSVFDSFSDASSIPATSKDAWCYSIHRNIILGDGSGHLMPNGSLTRAQLAALIYRIDDIFAANLSDSELWDIPEGDTVLTEAPENAATVIFNVSRINNRYLIENEKGEYICTTSDVTVIEGASFGEWYPYVYGTIPCYDGEYILEIPFPWYYFVIPDSESFTITPQYSDNVTFGFRGFAIDGYGIEKLTFEGTTVTIYGTRATIRTTNADTAGYTVVFADK